MDLDPGLRRRPLPDPAEVGEDPALVERLRTVIETDGPITFAHFMATALYDPDHGYYRTAEARPTRSGDFLTAAELHPVFGRMIGRQLTEAWERLGRPDPFVLREDGAGSGTLGLAVHAGLVADGSGLAEVLRYLPVELNEHRLAELRRRFADAGLEACLLAPDAASGRFTGAILANELLDALPVHRLTVVDGALREILVGWDGRFVDVIAAPSTPALAARLEAEGVVLAEGQRAEVSLAIDPWLSAASTALERGLIVVIDYGHPAAELYGPDRREGRLRAYVRHTVHGDPYVHVGRQDLTAHVDLTAVERAAEAAGLDLLGTTSQAEFLAGLGLGEVLASAGLGPLDEAAAYLELRAAVVRLIDPRAMGGFKVVLLGRGLAPEPPLAGLSFRLPPRPGSPDPR
ncbi:MAG TPA: SAM-dependent methyltransferase [Candidatus Limnocylindrales bacterium]|nr:SAM-dependent methyltransferase [Candidatus Limnocylindrales bacterium]